MLFLVLSPKPWLQARSLPVVFIEESFYGVDRLAARDHRRREVEPGPAEKRRFVGFEVVVLVALGSSMPTASPNAAVDFDQQQRVQYCEVGAVFPPGPEFELAPE